MGKAGEVKKEVMTLMEEENSDLDSCARKKKRKSQLDLRREKPLLRRQSESGIQRLYDCPRVIIRLQEKENGPKIPKNEPAKPAATPKPPATPVQKKPSRQTSK